VDLDAIPRREPGMEPFEVLISESQERMVAIVEPHRWDAVRAICDRWDLPSAVIGRVTAEPEVVVLTAPDASGALDADGRPVAGARELARIPARALASEAIVFERESRQPARRRAAPAPGAPVEPVDALPVRGQDPGAVLLALLGSPNLASRHAVYEQYDSNVQSNTVAAPGRGAAVLRIKGTTKALVATTDGNAPVGVLDPWLGAAMSVAEAARNVSITGARPLGVTNCLNYGDPTRPEAFWQLAEGVRGLGDACRALDLPVTGGNVSLYNEAPGSAIAPTPEIGIVGLLDDVGTLVGPAFRGDDHAVVLVGEAGPGLAGSEYARLAGAAPEDGPPALDLDLERRLQAFIREAIARGLVESCQDVSGGGLAVAVAEQAIWGGRGARLRLPVGDSPAVALFGESPSRLLVETLPRHAPALELLGRHHGLPVETIGTTGGSRVVVELTGGRGATGAVEERGGGIADALDVPVADLRHAWDHGLSRALGWDTPWADAAEGVR
jgi:phosphoribosylformylglycinamidine synthase